VRTACSATPSPCAAAWDTVLTDLATNRRRRQRDDQAVGSRGCARYPACGGQPRGRERGDSEPVPPGLRGLRIALGELRLQRLESLTRLSGKPRTRKRDETDTLRPSASMQMRCWGLVIWIELADRMHKREELRSRRTTMAACCQPDRGTQIQHIHRASR